MRFLAVVLGTFFLLTGLGAQNAGLEKLFKDYYETGLRLSPESATFIGRNDYNDRWSDWSAKGIEEERQYLQGFQKRLAPFLKAQLNDQERLSVELLDDELRTDLERLERLRPFFVVNHFFGPHLRVQSTIAAMPANTVKDFEDRIARLRAIPKLVDGLIETATQARAKNMVPAQVVVQRLLAQLETQKSPTADQAPLLAAFRKMPPSISAADQERLKKAAAEAYTESFQPAWAKYRKFIEDSYVPNPRKTLAISDLPNGKDHYAFLVRSSTTTSYTPEQIHEIGKREVDRIFSEMAAIRKELGFTGSADEFTEKVLNAPEMRFKTEAEILAHGRDIAKRIDPELPRLFRKLPRMPYGVRAIPADRARTAAPYYEGPALDGSRAGNFYLRTFDPPSNSKCCMEALILHEAVPGHHLQIALAIELEGIPEFRKVGGYTAFSEGWGLYAESLGSDLNMYQTPYERYGRLQSEALRALRLVVDTGLHHFGWTRDQAVTMLSRAKGGWINDELVSSEVDRYIAIPSQALAYKIGELKIKELRAKAASKLGAKFDIREFHDVVLRNGALPLTILEREIDRWLATK